jgi:[glutamine synthetase] adenylyltransferase / [glutamine synthetase]-adenylyl-L-tyrosine phosphorylase
LIVSERLRQRKTAEEILADLRHGAKDADQMLWLRRYHEAEQMRLGLRDILGLADFEQNLVELTALAEACLQYALEVVMREHRLKRAPFAIIGLGKLGGREIVYGSDLDVLFVASAKARGLPKLQKIAARVMDLLSRRTEQGIVFATDARLRPDGENGLLVNTLTAYEEYYRQRAQLWEIQSLTRSRPVAGDLKVGAAFQKLTAELTDFSAIAGFAKSLSNATKAGRGKRPKLPVSGVPNWKQQIHDMRLRIEKERTPKGKDDLAIKTGKGGLMDAEFIAQALCLEHGWHEPNTLSALHRGHAAQALPQAELLIENYRKLRRLEGILRRWSYEGETVLPDDPAPYYRVAVRCGFATADEFRAALAQWRKAIRTAFDFYFRKSRANRS